MQIFKSLQIHDRSRLTVVFAIASNILFFVAAVPLAVSNAGSPQHSPCKPDSWQVLVGVVESVDTDGKHIEIRIRGGATGIPKRLTNEDWGKLEWSKPAQTSLQSFDLQLRPEANQKAKLRITTETSVFRERATIGLRAEKPPEIETGASVLLALAAGQCWPSSEKEAPRWASEPTIAKIVLLQACIEESCVKAKCKGKTGCKEKVCNCPETP
jgi:hypothetical protein